MFYRLTGYFALEALSTWAFQDRSRAQARIRKVRCAFGAGAIADGRYEQRQAFQGAVA